MTAANRDGLPLPDYDQLSVETLTHRIRSLTAEQIDELQGYERAHANRAPVLQVLEQRAEQLASGATPSPGSSQERPEQPPAPSGGSQVTPETAAPPIHPPRHGAPDLPGKQPNNP
ncbi:hypothetical protein [Streptomyces sp. 8N706]|uniref:hypothetical protein n=1 Tax=Streptomyces sp. 8N706 TaxID=3457416 RepID=UPI003FCF2DD2